MAQSVAEWFSDEKNQVLVDRLTSSGLTMNSVDSEGPRGPLSGKTFLLTGKLDHISRGSAERALQDLGAKIARGSASRSTT